MAGPHGRPHVTKHRGHNPIVIGAMVGCAAWLSLFLFSVGQILTSGGLDALLRSFSIPWVPSEAGVWFVSFVGMGAVFGAITQALDRLFDHHDDSLDAHAALRPPSLLVRCLVGGCLIGAVAGGLSAIACFTLDYGHAIFRDFGLVPAVCAAAAACGFLGMLCGIPVWLGMRLNQRPRGAGE
jgi:hypothetical protein